MQPAERRGKFPRAFTVAVMAVATMVSVVGCSPKSDKSQASDTASNVTLTAAQRQNIHLYTAAPSKFHKTTEATGAVDFDNDQATRMLAPFSGPVSRLLVSPGDRVKKGQPLAVVDSPDFAAAISAYRKAIVTAHTLRRLANMDRDLVKHQGVSQREDDEAETDAVSAEADRDAALKALVSLNVDAQTIKGIRKGRTISRVEVIIR
jgi:cobalt-zinc-cadmium efflux system membrane fusion protein